MPEYPDVTVYIESLEKRILDQILENIRLASPFLLRTVEPPIASARGRKVVGLRRIGKRIVIELEEELFLVIHLMIAGRFRFSPKKEAPIPGRIGLAAFDFSSGTLLLTEAGTKKRASLHLAQGEEALAAHDRGGLELFECTLEQFAEALTRENHTLKRSLTDPVLFSGIGNAYSDEILHRARLSPMKLTQKLTEEEIARLFEKTKETLLDWTDRLRTEAGDGFPENVTAFREEMAVHGKYKQPCPVCGTKIQRVIFAENEMNYCPRCQNEGRMLADRSLSRLLKKDWPKTIDELEGLKRQ
jgi:formamidopyrimidine-DNA glycosylase